MEVEGHTDDRPIATSQFPSNWQLSGARAGAVVQRLMGAGVAGKRVSLGGYAAQQPVASNATRRRAGTQPPGRDRPDPAAWSNHVARRRHTMNKKIIIIAVVALVAAGGAYKTVLAKPKAKAQEAERRGHGLRAARRSSWSTSPTSATRRSRRRCVLNPKDHSTAAAGGHGAPVPPEGYGPMAQEAVVRAIITDVLTGRRRDELEDAEEAREAAQARSSSGSTRRPTSTRTTSCSPT